MRISKVHIENFRSVKDLTFEPGQYCVLIGENNAGKSNILRAIGLILGDAWPSERNFTEEDFFNQDVANDIVIQVFFDEIQEEWRNKHKMEIAGFELRCHALQRRSGKKQRGELTVTYACIDQNGKECKYPAESGQYRGQWLPCRVTKELRERTPFIYVDVLRSYERHTPSSRWSVLRKLFDDVNTEFQNDKKTVTVELPDGNKQKLTRKEAFEYFVKDAYKYLKTDSYKKLEERLVSNVLEQMGIEPGEGEISLHFESHDPANAYKALQLYIDQMGISSPANEVGSGLQSAIVVGIFRTYEEFKKDGAIFAIEEPEVFLHPQKARYFQTVLQDIADGGNQVFVTSHSPIFVQIHRPEYVATVRRTAADGSRIVQPKSVDLSENERQALRLMTEFNAERNELFFAKGVMLVEGATEAVALPLAFQALGTDINRLGISVIEVGGKTKFPLFIRVLNALGIPYIVLADRDVRAIDAEWSNARKNEETNRNKKHERWNDDIAKACKEGSLFWMEPCFEAELGLPNTESEKVDQALVKFHQAKADDIPECLRKPIEALLIMANQ